MASRAWAVVEQSCWSLDLRRSAPAPCGSAVAEIRVDRHRDRQRDRCAGDVSTLATQAWAQDSLGTVMTTAANNPAMSDCGSSAASSSRTRGLPRREKGGGISWSSTFSAGSIKCVSCRRPQPAGLVRCQWSQQQTDCSSVGGLGRGQCAGGRHQAGSIVGEELIVFCDEMRCRRVLAACAQAVEPAARFGEVNGSAQDPRVVESLVDGRYANRETALMFAIVRPPRSSSRSASTASGTPFPRPGLLASATYAEPGPLRSRRRQAHGPDGLLGRSTCGPDGLVW